MALRDLALFALLVGAVPFILWRPWIGVLFYYWIGLMNPHRMSWGFMYDFPAAMLMAASTLAGLVLAKDRRPPPMTRESILLVLLVVWFTITTVNAWAPAAAWGYWEQAMKVLVFTLVTTMLIHGRFRCEWFLVVVTGSIAFFGLKGGVFTLVTGGGYRVSGPPESFIAGNTELGLAMVMVMPLLLVLARKARAGELAHLLPGIPQRLLGVGGYAVFWLTAVSALFTYSRGAFLGLAAIAPFMFLKMRYKPVLLALALAAGSSVAVLVPDKLIDRLETIENYEQDDSAMQRIQAWGVNLNIALEHPLGAGFQLEKAGDARWIGYANFIGDWAPKAYSAHSIYFQVLGQHGFFGLALYVALLLGTIARLFRLRRQAAGDPATAWIRDYAWALAVGLVSFAVTGAFLNLAYFTLLYAGIAACVVLHREYRESAGGQVGVPPVAARQKEPAMPQT